MDNIFLEIRETITKPLVVTVYMTSHCNLNCSYCYEQDKEQTENISLERIRSFISSLDEAGIEVAALFLFGGEPTLCTSECIFLLNYLEQFERYKKTRKVIFTNGILISNELLEWISSGKLEVFLSMDGLGYASIERYGNSHMEIEMIILNNVKKMRTVIQNVTISIALGKHNVDTVVKDMKFLKEQYGISNFKINIIRKNKYASSYIRIIEEREKALRWAEKEKIVLLWDDPYEFGSQYDNLYVSQKNMMFQPAGQPGIWSNVSW